mmetsp:Transcript_3993/g.12323  ORF Transcript_3993/g.12323 Transcript_3993/m.12323 type:complete len:197 (-) Transcript_3993:41-631(-)
MFRVWRAAAVFAPGPRRRLLARCFAAIPGADLYVKGLRRDLASTGELEIQVRALFAECCDVRDVRVPEDRDGAASRGFAFVTVAPEDADQARRFMDGAVTDGRQLSVVLSLASEAEANQTSPNRARRSGRPAPLKPRRVNPYESAYQTSYTATRDKYKPKFEHGAGDRITQGFQHDRHWHSFALVDDRAGDRRGRN